MEDLNSINKRPHKVTLLGRRTCNLTGVNDVLSFDEREVILETEQGMLMMKGSGGKTAKVTAGLIQRPGDSKMQLASIYVDE